MSEPFDIEINALLENTFQIGSLMESPYNREQLRMKIVATNLRALAKTFMTAAEHPEVVSVNFNQVALGILGTVDFLENGLPETEETTTIEGAGL